MSDLSDIVQFLNTHPNTYFKIIKDPETLDQDEVFTIIIATHNPELGDTPKGTISGVASENLSFNVGALLDSLKIIFE